MRIQNQSIFRLLLIAGFTALSCYGKAQLKLPQLISDGMILQRDQSIPLWGWANAGDEVKIRFNNKTYTAKTGKDKKWMVKAAVQKAGGPFSMILFCHNDTIRINDILVGDVWLCSGQSNMEFPVSKAKEKYAEEIAASANPEIRQFYVKHSWSFDPQEDVGKDVGWKQANPENVLSFTAAGYFFARELYERYHVPVGLINASYGGTPLDAWISNERLQPIPAYKAKADSLRDTSLVNAIQKRDKEILDRWNRETKFAGRGDTTGGASATAVSTSAAKRPPVTRFYLLPTATYNSMIAPLIPFALKGCIWYQGEANVSRGQEYQQMFPVLIKDWQERWGQKSFPFLYVQLPNFGKAQDLPSEGSWPELREAQATALSLKGTGMTVNYDLGEWNNIHPLNKKEIGHRLALLARKLAYHEDELVAVSPMMRSVTIAGNKIIVAFRNTGGGLVIHGGSELKGFALAGKDKKFYWANAKIEGDTVIVWNDHVTEPVAVRYAWAGNPEGSNLYNKEGLPAAPFRSDSWPRQRSNE